MLQGVSATGLETKFCRFEEGVGVSDAGVITGYASVFGAADQGGDVVQLSDVSAYGGMARLRPLLRSTGWHRNRF
jgi:hypothetical protein